MTHRLTRSQEKNGHFFLKYPFNNDSKVLFTHAYTSNLLQHFFLFQSLYSTVLSILQVQKYMMTSGINDVIRISLIPIVPLYAICSSPSPLDSGAPKEHGLGKVRVRAKENSSKMLL